MKKWQVNSTEVTVPTQELKPIRLSEVRQLVAESDAEGMPEDSQFTFGNNAIHMTHRVTTQVM